jgi:large subunit ribosomal protein L17
MRHKKAGRKFDRAGDERKALLRGLVSDLLRHERLKTTEAKAKEIRPIAEKMITLGKDGTVHARRMAFSYVNDKDVVKKLFDDIAPRFASRPGGYTRIIKLGPRLGDGAAMAQVELVERGEAAAATG